MRLALPSAVAWRHVGALVALSAALGAGRAGFADDPPLEPPPAEPAVVAEPLAQVRTDPDGVATDRARELFQLLREGAPAAQVRAAIAAVLRAGPDVLVPLEEDAATGAGAGISALRVPVRELVERVAWVLTPGERARLGSELPGVAVDLWRARARAGDEAALLRLTEAPILDVEAHDALLARAERDLEAGRAAAAAQGFARWRRLGAQASPAMRVAVASRQLEALAALGDLDGLARVAGADAGLPAGDTTLGELAGRRRAALEVGRVRAPSGELPPLPSELRLLWSRALVDSGLRGLPPAPEVVTHALHAEPDLLLLHEGRRVRRIDPLTGRERWTFPAGALGWDYHPGAKYQSHDVPLRCVTRAGDFVLAVLGDPGASGTFEQQRGDIDVDSGPRESRGRLVALDLARGTLRWHTGSPRESDPILGERAASCISPPLVAGDAVYALFARRFGVVELYAACLALADGRPRWVAYLGAAESGRDPGAAAADMRARGRGGPVRAVPWGAMPALADGELCVLPHAGLAAGLDPETGHVRWLRALPRFLDDQLPLRLDAGHGPRNAPVAAPGAWILAPQDGPDLVALERGTGALRWSRPTALVDGDAWAASSVVRDLLGWAPSDAAMPGLRVSGRLAAWIFDGPVGEDGSLAGSAGRGPWPEPAAFPGRALDLGPWVARVVDGYLHVRAWPGEAPPPVLARKLPAPGVVPIGDADLYRAGPVWLALAPRRLCAYAASNAVSAAPRGVPSLAGTASDPGASQLAGQALLERLSRAIERGEAPGDDLLAQLELLPDGLRARGFDLAREGLQAAKRVPAAVELLGRWIDSRPELVALPDVESGRPPDEAAVGAGGPEALEPSAAPRVRSDLLAADLLRRLAALEPAAPAVARREADVARRLEAALAGSDASALAEALRSAAGTQALTQARLELLDRARRASRFGEAAAWAADLRLDPPAVERAEPARARTWAARWQLREAGWRARAGDVPAARSLLSDLLRWVPSGTHDDEGLTTSALLAALAAQHGFAVSAGARAAPPLRFADDVATPLERDAARAVVLPGIEGPGAWRLKDRLLVVRGLSLEVRDLAGGRVLAEIPTGDQGWFGGSLQDVASWLPERGVRVASVVAGEPADRAGVHAGDWIVGWAGTPLLDTADLMARIVGSEPGVELGVDVLRGGRPVLERFTAGRRPLAESAGTIERERLWADEAGRVLVPVRNGLLRVDLGTASSERLWNWPGPGTVQRVQVTGGLAVVSVRRLHDDDLLVALDPASGRELWRRDVDGAVAWVRATGSALHVQVDDPASVVVLGREDGQVRLVLPRVASAYERYPNTLVRAETAAPAAGRVWVVTGYAAGTRLDVANTTTGRVALVARESHRGMGGHALPPVLSADAYVAVIVAPGLIRVHEPDPLEDGVLASGALDASLLMPQADHHGGPLTTDSRVICSGATLYVLRLRPAGSSGRSGATISVFARLDPPGRPSLRLMFVDRPMPLLPGGGELYVTALEEHPDGLLAAAVSAYRGPDGAYARSVLWVPNADAGADRDSSPAPFEGGVNHWRRSPPVRVGPWLLLPDDAGATLVPVRHP